MKVEHFLVKNQGVNKIVDFIGKRFSLRKDVVRTIKQSYYDTFDLRLLRSGLAFYKTNSSFFMEELDPSPKSEKLYNNVKGCTTFKSSKQIKFWNDFPDSELQERLKPILYIRALVEIGNLTKTSHHYNVVDDEGQIVSKIVLEDIVVDQLDFPGIVLVLKPLRGYDNYHGKLLDLFSSAGFACLSQKDFVKSIVEITRAVPARYSTKLARIDDCEMLSRDAVTKLLASLLNIVKINRRGVMDDIDTEFLHDFRVALRKTRSILNLLKELFDEDNVSSFRSETTVLAKSTNILRDYDVYLLNKDNYRSVLPEHLLQGLNYFFTSVKRRKRNEQLKLVKRLDSEFYHQYICKWEDLLETGKLFDDIKSSRPVINVACKHIYARFEKLLKDGAKIKKKSPDLELHKLRIDCKKLRYLIEFFSGLFPYEKMVKLTTQLKKLQTVLGEFNDYSVQQAHFEEYLSAISSKNHSIELAATIGALITTSYQEKQNRRSQFYKIFKKFTDKKNITLYERLFKQSLCLGATKPQPNN